MTAEAGVLYVVATPIGHREDISARALDILRSATVILAEDTRHSAHLLGCYGISTPMQSLHDHNETARIDNIKQRLRAGEALALISDAGTPLISDPGYKLVSALRADSLRVVPIPGASAVIAALSAAGLPTDRFSFEGFLPAKTGPRQARLKTLKTDTRTLVFYEAPHRIEETLRDAAEIFGADRSAVIAREITKTFETFLAGELGQLIDRVASDSDQQRGEIVLMIKGADEEIDVDAAELDRVLSILQAQVTNRQAVDIAEQLLGLPHKKIYQRALALKAAQECAEGEE